MRKNTPIIVVTALLLQASLFLYGSQSAAETSDAKASNLTRLLEAELARFPAKSGIYVKHLGTGEEASVLADDHFESASTIKLAAMVLAFRMAEAGALNLDDRTELKASDMRGGSGIYRYKDLGLNPTLRDLITEMIITSDNTATDIVIAKVGGKEKINAYLQQSGYVVLRQIRTTYEFFRQLYAVVDPKYDSLTPEDVFALCCTKIGNDPAFSARRQKLTEQIDEDSAELDVAALTTRLAENEANWFGAASPREMGRLLESIESCTIASKDSCDQMKRMMLAQKSGELKIPHYLQVPVGHKTGETGDITNDVGIIYAKSGPIVVSFYNMFVVGLRAETEDRMGHVARLIVEYFDGSGS
jgi:beta-lactamase class A